MNQGSDEWHARGRCNRLLDSKTGDGSRDRELCCNNYACVAHDAICMCALALHTYCLQKVVQITLYLQSCVNTKPMFEVGLGVDNNNIAPSAWYRLHPHFFLLIFP